MEVSPSIWGEYYWFVYYTTALTYSNNPSIDDKKSVKKMYLSLSENLPCNKCRHNFKDHIKKYPLNNNALKSSDSLLKWVVDINNEVNKTTGKKQVTSEKMRQKYLKIYNNIYINKKYYHYIYVIVCIVVMFFLIILFKCIYN